MPRFENIPIIHITHIDNLVSIVADGMLFSDAKNVERSSCKQQIGMSRIKRRRLEELPVTCHQGTKVGEYVPFYFYHHSPMLYLIHKRNVDLAYKGGQEHIVHLVSTMSTGIKWANDNSKKWAFTSSNAGAYVCDFYCDIGKLDKIQWEHVRAMRWADCKEEKQAEFLVQECFPLSLVTHVVTYNSKVKSRVKQAFSESEYTPEVESMPGWYY